MANNIIGTVGIGAQSVKPDWNQNDPNAKDYIKNRPGGYAVAPSVEITWDGDTTGKETIVVPDKGTLVKIADEAPSIEKFAVGTSYKAVIMFETTYSDGSNETGQKQIDLIYQEDFWVGQDVSSFSGTFGVTVDSVNINGLTLTKGLWFSIVDGAEMQKFITCGISTTDGGVKKFPVSSMPDEVLSAIDDVQENSAAIVEVAGIANNATSVATGAKTTAEAAKTTAEAAKTTAEAALKVENGTVKVSGNVALQNTSNALKIGSYTVSGTTFPRTYLGVSRLVINSHDLNPGVKTIALEGETGSANPLSKITLASNDGLYLTIDSGGTIKRFKGVTINDIVFTKSAITIPSSTPNSTKKFKITVDDAGVISATEVTS